jgi:NAD(P)-dependent dehydrogenase (short-subunit alcohol dehydrogenase family)
MRFADKTVVVLGGNSGIGLAAARAFQAEGARVAITGRNESTLAQVAAASGMLAVRSDISRVADNRAAIARIAHELGGIDVLFVNAGVGGFAAVPQVTEAFWDSVHGVNLRGAFFAVQAALPHLRDGGSIVITGSIGALRALPGNVVYAAAKAGLRQAARILAAELLPRRIRVNVVSPGPIETEIFKRGASAEQIQAVRAALGGAVPMKRMGEPAEVARAVLFLASSEASFINGVDLYVDGGTIELSSLQVSE